MKKIQLLQELKDIIFLYLDYSTLENCIELQSEFVKTTTQYTSFNEAVDKGNLTALNWLVDQDITWNSRTFIVAAKNGNLEIMKWLREQGCPWNEDTFTCAAYNGDLQVMKWLREQGCPWNADTFTITEEYQYSKVLEWLKEQDCPQNDYNNFMMSQDLFRILISKRVKEYKIPRLPVGITISNYE